MQLERRYVKSGSVRASKGDKPGIKGVAAVYNQQYDAGYFVETIKPGAFARALQDKQDVRCLFNHDSNGLLARTKSGTLTLEDSADGLQYSADIDPNTTIGRDVLAMIERGDLDGCSFSFNVRKDSWRDEFDASGRWVKSYREIEDLDLFDVGPVTFPAYTQTSVSARSLFPEGVPAEVQAHVPSLRSDSETTKKVDGEELTRDCFLLVGDPDKTATWALPWKFSTAEKTKSHLRDALSRFDQVEGFSDDLLAAAWKKLLVLADHYGIDVADKTQPGSKSQKSTRDAADGDGNTQQDGEGGKCSCTCGPCGLDDCTNCETPDCAFDGCRCEMSLNRSLCRRAKAHIHAAATS